MKDRDAERIAKHFDVPLAKAETKFFRKAHGKRVMRRQKDEHFGRICQFLIPRNAAAPSITRPATCREFPARQLRLLGLPRFERNAQEDEDYISVTNHSGN